MKALKHNRQRESIKTCLIGHHDHPTVDALHASIREEFPNISLGTVYRSLNLLTKIGEIRKLVCGGGVVHFDGDTRQHYHFVCGECDQVYDMELGAMEDLNKGAQKHAPGVIDSHYALFYGRCNNCLQKKVNKAIDEPA